MKKPKVKPLTPEQRASIGKVLTRYARVFVRLKNAPKPKLVPFVSIPQAEFFAINGQPYFRLAPPNPTYSVIRCVDWTVVTLKPGFNAIRITPTQAYVMCCSMLQTEHLADNSREAHAMNKNRLKMFISCRKHARKARQ